MKRKTSSWSPLAAAVGAMLTLSALGGATVTDGVLVISVDSGSENIGDQVDSFSKIRKIGGGTAVLTGVSFKNFIGDIVIEQARWGRRPFPISARATARRSPSGSARRSTCRRRTAKRERSAATSWTSRARFGATDPLPMPVRWGISP